MIQMYYSLNWIGLNFHIWEKSSTWFMLNVLFLWFHFVFLSTITILFNFSYQILQWFTNNTFCNVESHFLTSTFKWSCLLLKQLKIDWKIPSMLNALLICNLKEDQCKKFMKRSTFQTSKLIEHFWQYVINVWFQLGGHQVVHDNTPCMLIVPNSQLCTKLLHKYHLNNDKFMFVNISFQMHLMWNV